MPEKARVFVAEDDPDFLDTLKLELESAGHTVVLSASTLESALEAIQTFPELGVQVASIDGNLERGVVSGSDGLQLVATIRNIAPNVRIIGMSSKSIPSVDVDLGKENLENLGEVVTNL